MLWTGRWRNCIWSLSFFHSSHYHGSSWIVRSVYQEIVSVYLLAMYAERLSIQLLASFNIHRSRKNRYVFASEDLTHSLRYFSWSLCINTYSTRGHWWSCQFLGLQLVSFWPEGLNLCEWVFPFPCSCWNSCKNVSVKARPAIVFSVLEASCFKSGKIYIGVQEYLPCPHF